MPLFCGDIDEECENAVAVPAVRADRVLGLLVAGRNRMIQWEKMAALGEMAASVAHEIRNPLVSIGGFSRRLRRLIPGDTAGHRYAEIIAGEVDRLERTLRDVLAASRDYPSLEYAQTDINKVMRECVELFRDNFRKKAINIHEDLPREPFSVIIDAARIKQSVINAGQALQEGGRVAVSTAISEDDDGYVEITISDTGGGIPPDVVRNIFNPFFTTKGTGTGLGLSVAQRAVLMHGGEIKVDNRPGEGITFTLSIPARPAADAMAENSLEDDK